MIGGPRKPNTTNSLRSSPPPGNSLARVKAFTDQGQRLLTAPRKRYVRRYRTGRGRPPSAGLGCSAPLLLVIS